MIQMNQNKIATLYKNTDEYEVFVEECKSIITEAVFISRWTMVEGYWNLGKRIREENKIKKYAKGSKSFVLNLAQDTGISERVIYYSLKAFDKYPNKDLLPEGKNLTVNKLITKYLTEPSKQKFVKPKTITCPKCGFEIEL